MSQLKRSFTESRQPACHVRGELTRLRAQSPQEAEQQGVYRRSHAPVYYDDKEHGERSDLAAASLRPVCFLTEGAHPLPPPSSCSDDSQRRAQRVRRAPARARQQPA